MSRKKQSLLRQYKNNKTISIKKTRGASGGVPLDTLVSQIEDEIKAVQLSFATNLGFKGTPGCLAAAKTFEPETTAFNITLPTGEVFPSSGRTDTYSVNYVVRDAQTYTIPIRNGASAAFCARYMTVSVVQRITNNQMVSVGTANQENNFQSWKFQLYPFSRGTYALETSLPTLSGGFNYFWNLEDAKSNRYLSDDLLSHLVLLPRNNQSPTLFVADGTIALADPAFNPRDGDLFEFEVPWLIERDGQAVFHFRPITPILQLASSDPKQQATLYVELHGHYMHADSDAAKTGAITRY